MECICPTAVSTPFPPWLLLWVAQKSLGNTGHRNPVQLFNSFSLLADMEFIYRENIQKCASRLMWGMEQHPQEAQIHKLWSLSMRRCYCRMWGVSGIVNSMKKSPRGDLFTGSGSSNRRSLALLHSVVFICRNPCCRMLCMLKVYMNRKKKNQNKPDKLMEGLKKASGYWITNLTRVKGDLCKLSGPGTILERHWGELCAVLTSSLHLCCWTEHFPSYLLQASDVMFLCLSSPMISTSITFVLKITDLVWFTLKFCTKYIFFYFEKHLDNSFWKHLLATHRAFWKAWAFRQAGKSHK